MADGRPLLAGAAPVEAPAEAPVEAPAEAPVEAAEAPVEAPALVLGAPLSFWGGVDPASGRIVDAHHPQHGESVAGRVLVMPSGRGSSSSSSVLAECLANGTGPAAILLGEPDPILLVGALVAAELGGPRCPVVVIGDARHRITTGDPVRVEPGGRVVVGRPA